MFSHTKRNVIALALATAAIQASAAPVSQAQLLEIQGQMAQMQSELKTLKSQVPQPGSVMAFAQGTVPDGWLECDGASYLETGPYHSLFTVINHTYESDGAIEPGRFRVPDLRGEFVRGFSHDRAGVDEGRVLGSAQIGTNVLIDDDDHHVVGNIDRSNNDLKFLGYEPASRGEVYLHASGNSGGSYKMPESYLRTTRPRNVAMIYAIKY